MPDDFEILHSLRVKGLAADAILAAMTGIPAPELPGHLAPLVDAGLVVRREGRLAGSSLTPSGRADYPGRLATDDATSTARPQLDAFYTAFLPINARFKTICHDWQMRSDTAPNDHTDPDYDDAVITRLAEVNDALDAHFAPVAGPLPRYARYRTRLTDALARIRSGDTAAFARPMYDSYHDIWMELHQDLLLSLGRDRDAHDEG
jgi:hypothetical protein